MTHFGTHIHTHTCRVEVHIHTYTHRVEVNTHTHTCQLVAPCRGGDQGGHAVNRGCCASACLHRRRHQDPRGHSHQDVLEQSQLERKCCVVEGIERALRDPAKHDDLCVDRVEVLWVYR